MKKILSTLTFIALLSGQAAWAAPQVTPVLTPSTTRQTNTQPTMLVGAVKSPDIVATAYLVQDLQSNQILAVKGWEQQVVPASLTKLMTAYVTFKALEEGKLKANQMLTVSKRAWEVEGSRMFLDMKKPVSVKDLIHGLLIHSANDAAITLAEGIAGSEEAFVVMMNTEAKRLGMNHTHFENAVGFPSENHLTTMKDLATLSVAIMRDFPKNYPIFSKKEFTYNGISQPNTNLLLFRDPNVDGLKTGYNSSSGYNLIATSKRDGRRVLSIVIGTSSKEARATESGKLLNYALQSFDTQKIYQKGQVINNMRVYKGADSHVEIGFQNDTFVTLPRGKGANIKHILETTEPMLAPVKEGQQLGVLKLMDGDKVIVEKPVVALKTVEEAGFFGRLWDGMVLWFKAIFSD